MEENESTPDAGGSEELTAIENMTERLTRAIEGVRQEANQTAIEAVNRFAESIEEKRSRTAPLPPKEESQTSRRGPVGDTVEAATIRAIGDGTAPLYRRGEQKRSHTIEQQQEYRAARNPAMDDLARQWCIAASNRDGGERRRLHDEMNGRYVEALGGSRAALLTGTPDTTSGFGAGTGGELLPLPLSSQLIVERDAISKMRGLVQTFPMTTQTQRLGILPIVVADTRAENAAYSDGTPAAGTALLSATDLGVMILAGKNFLEDSAFNMANQLTVVAGAAIGVAEDLQICTSTGAGSDITEGLDGATITTLATAGLTTIAYVDMVALYYTLPERFRANAKFFMAGTTLQDVISIIDGNSRPTFLSQFEAPRPISDTDPDMVGILMGKPVYEVPVADEKIYFGDPSWYALGNRSGIMVDVDRAITTGERTWVIEERIDGRVIPTSAVNTNNAWRKTSY